MARRVKALRNFKLDQTNFEAGNVYEVDAEVAQNLADKGLVQLGNEGEGAAPVETPAEAPAQEPAADGDNTFDTGAAEPAAEPAAPEVVAEPTAPVEQPTSTNSNVAPQVVPVNVVKG